MKFLSFQSSLRVSFLFLSLSFTFLAIIYSFEQGKSQEFMSYLEGGMQLLCEFLRKLIYPDCLRVVYVYLMFSDCFYSGYFILDATYLTINH